MSYKRFFPLEKDNSIFRFTVDTRLIVVGATDGSQLDNEMKMPYLSATERNFILKVSDGRPDVNVTRFVNPSLKLTFATPGIYEITMIGSCDNIRFGGLADVKKLIRVDEWGRGFKNNDQTFFGCSNLEFYAKNVALYSLDRTFNNIKKIDSSVDLSQFNVQNVNRAFLTFSGIQQIVPSVFSGFFLELTNINQYLKSTNLTLVSNISIIAPKLKTAQEAFSGSGYTGRIEIRSEDLTDITWIFRYVTNPPSLGEVDIRNVTIAPFFINSVMSTVNVDATLLGWQNNFEWTNITPVTNKVTLDFYNSKYSNTPSVIAAKTFLESKGITFTRLTMA